MTIQYSNEDRELWKWLDEHVPGWSFHPSERVHASTNESWEAYVNDVKKFVLSLKDLPSEPGVKNADEYDEKFLDSVKPLYWPPFIRSKWGPIRSKSR